MPKPLLVKKTLDDVDMFFAPDDDVPFDDMDLEAFRLTRLAPFLDNENFNLVIDNHAKQYGLKPKTVGVLCAHGADLNYKWMFDDTKKLYNVQSWINKHDGKYSALMLYCCNPGHLEVCSKKSALLLPNADYSAPLLVSGDVILELSLPEFGVMESYDLEHYIRDNNLR